MSNLELNDFRLLTKPITARENRNTKRDIDSKAIYLSTFLNLNFTRRASISEKLLTIVRCIPKVMGK